MDQPLRAITDELKAITGELKVIRAKAVNKNIFRALLSLASAALLIRMMGLLNQVVVSSRFGAGPRMDAYFIASSFPTLLASLFGSTLEASVIPAYAQVRTRGTREQAHRLFSTLLNLFVLGTVLMTLLMLLFHSQVIFLSAPGSPARILDLAASLAPIIFPAFTLMAVLGYLECIFNAEGQFGWPAYAGVLVPLTTAVFVFTMGRSAGVIMLCVGTIVGLCLQFGVFLIRARRAGLAYHFVLDLRIPEVGSIMKAAWPVLIGALLGQAINMIDQIFASFLPAGSISALNYALKLTSVFTGVIFVSVGRAILPYLSRQAAAKDMKAFKETLRLYIWILTLATMVLSIGTIILAQPVVHILFQRGAFSANDTTHTAITFIGFCVGLTPMALVFTLLRAFSALGKTKIFLRVTLSSLAVNASLDYVFSHLWQSEGIALSTSVSYVCSMLILFFALRRSIGELHIFTPPKEIVDFLGKVRDGSFRLPYAVQQQMVRLGIILAVFVTGIAGVFLNSLYAWRIALASTLLLVLLRYEFLLLVLWVLFNGPNGMPIFRGTNLLIALTIPTLLLMVSLPIKPTIKRVPALSLLFTFLLWSALSLGISPFGLGPSVTAWVLRVDCLGVSILAINVLTTRRRLMICIDVLLLVAAAIASYGIYGYFTKQNGLIDPSTSLFRIISIFVAAPSLALFLSLVIPVAIYRASTLQGLWRIICAVSVLVFLVAAALTFTRAVYISIPLSIFLMALLAPSRRMRNALLSSLSMLAVATLLLSTIGNVPILTRFFNQDITTLNGRTYLWNAVLSNFDVTKLLGNGIRASDALLTNLHVGVNGQGEIGTSPHSLFLGTLYDHGVIGLILLCLVFFVLAINLLSGMRKASGEHRTVFVVALAVLANVIVQSIDSNDLWDQAISIYIWVILVLPFAVCWFTAKQPVQALEGNPGERTVQVIEDHSIERTVQVVEDDPDEKTEVRIKTVRKSGREHTASI